MVKQTPTIKGSLHPQMLKFDFVTIIVIWLIVATAYILCFLKIKNIFCIPFQSLQIFLCITCHQQNSDIITSALCSHLAHN